MSNSPTTLSVPTTLPVPTGLQVWWAQVNVGELGDEVRADLAGQLSPGTLAKVNRYHRAQDRDRGLAAHALLRQVLAAVVGGRPADLELSTHCVACGKTEHGKPYLDLGGRPSPVEFNLTHSGEVVCLVLAPAGVQVGVDVEVSRAVDWSSLRHSVFADVEWERTETEDDPAQRRTDAWARKEASVKASGHGLALPLRSVVITDADRPASWTAVLPDGAGSAAGWDLALLPRTAAAVAIHAVGAPTIPPPPAVHRVVLAGQQVG